MSDCLIELGTEELPPKALLALSEAFVAGIRSQLQDAGLAVEEIEPFATPRRLALLLKNVPLRQQDRVVEKRGPALAAAFDADGNPTRAAEGFARSCGVEVSELAQRETDKGSWLYYEHKQKGQALTELLPDMVTQALAALPIPKRMRWGERADEFVRPVHWLLMLLDDKVIKANILGSESGNQTYGHRFHAPQALVIPRASDYPQLLKNQAFVIPCRR